MAQEAVVNVGVPFPEDPLNFYDEDPVWIRPPDAAIEPEPTDATVNQLDELPLEVAQEVPEEEEEGPQYSRTQLRSYLDYALSIGDKETADRIAADLQKPLTFSDSGTIIAAMYDVGGDSWAQNAGIFMSTEESIERGLQGKGLIGSEITEAEKERILRELYNKYGYLPDTKVELPTGGEHTVESLLDSSTGLGPSLTFTAFGVGTNFLGPLKLAAIPALYGGVYNYSVNANVNELARVLKENGVEDSEIRRIIEENMSDLRAAGAVEAGSEVVGSFGLGKVIKGVLIKTLGIKTTDSIIKKALKGTGIAAGSGALFVAEESLEEGVSQTASGQIKKGLEEKIEELNKGDLGGEEASVETFTKNVQQAVPGVALGGGVTTVAVGGVTTGKTAYDKFTGQTQGATETGKIKSTADFVADNAARKSVSVLDPWLDLPAGRQLRDLLEHREYGDQPGNVKPRDFFETKLNELGDLYHGVDQALGRIKDNLTGRFLMQDVRNQLNSFIESTPRLSKHLNDAVRAARAGDRTKILKLKGKDRKTAEIAAAASEIRETVKEIEYRFQQLGIRPAYSKGRGGMPLFFDTKYIRNNAAEFDTWLQRDGYAKNAVHAQEIRQGILETGGVPFLQRPKAYQRYQKPKGQETPGVVSKKFKADTVPQQFKNSKIETALPQFAMKAATRIAHAKQFGKNGEKITKLVNDMVNQARAQGRIIPKGVVDKVYDIESALIGQYNTIRTEGLSKANKAATVIAAASTLGGATFSSLQEPLVIIERVGLTPTLRALPDAMNQAFRGTLRTFHKKFKQANIMQVAEEIGIAQEYANAEILTQTFSAEHASLLDTYFKSPLGLFLYQWTRWVRAWATGAGMFKFNQYQREMARGKLSNLSREQLADLGISEADMRAMTSVFTQAGTTFRDVLIQNANQPNAVTEALLDVQLPSGSTARELLRSGLVRMVNESVMAPRATIRPMWLNDPHFALLGNLKSFPITFGNTVIKRILRKIDPRKIGCSGRLAQALGSVAVAGGLVAIAYNSQMLKHGIWGRDEDSPRYKPTVSEAGTPKELLSTRFGEAVQQAGLLGAAQFLIDMYRFKPETTLGPTINDMASAINEAIQWGEGGKDTADIMESLGQRTARGLGVIGKSKEIQESFGETFREMVE